ncbi:hypothetical protein BT93_L3997 [Corymbia citriodora subsp. variegata]|uniref:Secreted protein n=1 Tax=Corymbia citriodora subsp. variegata TaxID=360336 RepID=A0A8T0CUY0_CORYI|nr:hypothetical protein BT93_L3997 [Corymbia citriodora subsp. variegata]
MAYFTGHCMLLLGFCGSVCASVYEIWQGSKKVCVNENNFHCMRSTREQQRKENAPSTSWYYKRG